MDSVVCSCKQAMPFALQELKQAFQAYRHFMEKRSPAHHARYIFPFFAGSYFAYRKVDVLRTVAVAKASGARYLDIGCGYGDFLVKVREYLPHAGGIEKEDSIFYAFGMSRPNYIQALAIEYLSQPIDIAFIGWMEPGADFRRNVAKISKCVITTFDAGGQCGINGGCEYDEFGYERVAWWRTPSWIDINAELMNKYYTPSLTEEKKQKLAGLRSAHNFWYVYARPEIANNIRASLKAQLAIENANDRYDFESVLDECGFGYMQRLENPAMREPLWQVQFD